MHSVTVPLFLSPRCAAGGKRRPNTPNWHCLPPKVEDLDSSNGEGTVSCWAKTHLLSPIIVFAINVSLLAINMNLCPSLLVDWATGPQNAHSEPSQALLPSDAMNGENQGSSRAAVPATGSGLLSL